MKRAVRISFLYMKHKTCLLSRKFKLPRGIYLDEAYPDAIKQKHAILRPILKSARSKEEYKVKCKLQQDQLIIKGKQYTTETLDRLPEDLATYEVAQCSSETCLVFHGHHTPLSNFHCSPFFISGHKFNSAEQFIQYKKACHFNDYVTSEKIRQSNQPNEAKTLSQNIANFDKESWKAVAKDACYPGIKAKFEQNPLLLQFLCSTSPLRLAESCYDKLW